MPLKEYSENASFSKNKNQELYFDDIFVQNHNPYIRTVVRRTRKFLEDTINKETGEYYLENWC